MSAYDDNETQSIDSVETYAYGINKEYTKKEEIKCINILQRHKKWLTVTMLQKKT